MQLFAEFFNAALCANGKSEQRPLYVNLSTGLIVDPPSSASSDVLSGKPEDAATITESYDLRGHVLAPAYIDVQANGAGGFAFEPTRGVIIDGKQEIPYHDGLKHAAKNILACGTGAFLATLPTLRAEAYQKILPELQPQTFSHGAELLGAHCEGPWLSPAQKMNHDSSLMQLPSKSSVEEIYGELNLPGIKKVTLAPELPETMNLIRDLAQKGERVVALGHSNGGVDVARFACHCGARCITHLFHGMVDATSKDPGFLGWIASPSKPFFTIHADGRKVHPYLVSLAFKANPARCILITDSSPMVGLSDGLYRSVGGASSRYRVKRENRILHASNGELIESCVGLDECVRNLMKFAGCTLAEAVRCATENVANLLGLVDRGILEVGRRADFVILDEMGFVVEVWQAGRCTFRSSPKKSCTPDN